MRHASTLFAVLLLATTAATGREAYYYRNVTGSGGAVANPVAGSNGNAPVAQPLSLSSLGWSETFDVLSPGTGRISASGGSGTYTFSHSGLPEGLDLSVNGATATVTGQAMRSGTGSANVTVSDGNSTRSINLPFTVNPAQATIAVTEPSGRRIAGIPYVATATATNEVGGLSWDLASASNDWISVETGTGKVSALPPQGTSAFSYRVQSTDALARKSLAPAVSVVLEQPSLTGGEQGLAGQVNFPLDIALATNLPTPIWNLVGAPTWLSVTSGGHLVGTPPIAAGARDFAFQASARQGTASATSALTLHVEPPQTSSSIWAKVSNIQLTGTFTSPYKKTSDLIKACLSDGVTSVKDCAGINNSDGYVTNVIVTFSSPVQLAGTYVQGSYSFGSYNLAVTSNLGTNTYSGNVGNPATAPATVNYTFPTQNVTQLVFSGGTQTSKDLSEMGWVF